MQVLAWHTQLEFPILTIMQLLPFAGLLMVRFLGNRPAALSSLAIATLELLLAIYLYRQFNQDVTALQFGEYLNLFGPLDYHAAVDGISVMVLLLTNFLILIVSLYGPIRGLTPQNRFQTTVLGIQACLVARHGPFTWGGDAQEAVRHSVILEYVARMEIILRTLDPSGSRPPPTLIERHFNRKHGGGAYYGQG